MKAKRALTCLMAIIILATVAHPVHRAYAESYEYEEDIDVFDVQPFVLPPPPMLPKPPIVPNPLKVPEAWDAVKAAMGIIEQGTTFSPPFQTTPPGPYPMPSPYTMGFPFIFNPAIPIDEIDSWEPHPVDVALSNAINRIFNRNAIVHAENPNGEGTVRGLRVSVRDLETIAQNSVERMDNMITGGWVFDENFGQQNLRPPADISVGIPTILNIDGYIITLSPWEGDGWTNAHGARQSHIRTITSPTREAIIGYGRWNVGTLHVESTDYFLAREGGTTRLAMMIIEYFFNGTQEPTRNIRPLITSFQVPQRLEQLPIEVSRPQPAPPNAPIQLAPLNILDNLPAVIDAIREAGGIAINPDTGQAIDIATGQPVPDEVIIVIPDELPQLAPGATINIGDLIFPITIVQPGQPPGQQPTPVPPPGADVDVWLNHISNVLNNINANVRDLPSRIADILPGNSGSTDIDFDFTGIPETPDFEFNFWPILDNMPNLMDYFPFSIPLDLYNTFRVMAGTMPIEALGLTRNEQVEFMALHTQGYEGINPALLQAPPPPRWEIELPDPFNYTLVLDLADFQPVINVIRWGLILFFTAGLIKITPMVIRW